MNNAKKNKHTYYTYSDENIVDCYLELNSDFYCERAVFISTTYKSDSVSYYYDGDYKMPDVCLVEDVKSMLAINQIEFEMQWGKVYTEDNEITFLLQCADIKRDD